LQSNKAYSESASFVTKNGVRLPVDDEKYLFPFLSPTTPGGHYRDSAPPGKITTRQRARVLLQIHQFLHLLNSFGVDLRGKSLLDIGTGNGMVPRLLLDFSELATAVGTDPYLDGEHQTSWQDHDRDAELLAVRAFAHSRSNVVLKYEDYADVVGLEAHSMRPGPVALGTPASKPYRFEQVGAHDLASMGNEVFDLVYCKAIEHIPDWPGVLRSAAAVMEPGGVFYLKHRSFFSYLGAHRYASIGTPWGHVLLTDAEYGQIARKFYPDRADKMIEFFASGLANPRVPVSTLIQMAQKEGFLPLAIIVEPSRQIERTQAFISHVDGFWDIISQNHPELGSDELFSGMHHILLRKTA
jgi:SAM-dependent methyltransferase